MRTHIQQYEDTNVAGCGHICSCRPRCVCSLCVSRIHRAAAELLCGCVCARYAYACRIRRAATEMRVLAHTQSCYMDACVLAMRVCPLSAPSPPPACRHIYSSMRTHMQQYESILLNLYSSRGDACARYACLPSLFHLHADTYLIVCGHIYNSTRPHT